MFSVLRRLIVTIILKKVNKGELNIRDNRLPNISLKHCQNGFEKFLYFVRKDSKLRFYRQENYGQWVGGSIMMCKNQNNIVTGLRSLF